MPLTEEERKRRATAAVRAWEARNPERSRELRRAANRRWNERHPDGARERQRRYRARLRAEREAEARG